MKLVFLGADGHVRSGTVGILVKKYSEARELLGARGAQNSSEKPLIFEG